MARLRILLPLLAIALLAVPAAALAFEPYAETDFLEITSATSAIFGGFVDDGGEPTDAGFKYDLGDSDFCSNEDGTAASAFNTGTAHITPDPANEEGWDLTANVSGLTGGAWYCFVLMATNPSGTSDGGFGFFIAGAPAAYTDDATVTGAGTATVTGAVYPSGQTATYYAEYDDVDSEWCLSDGSEGAPAHSTTPATLAYTDSDFHDVAVNVAGLAPGTEYCAQIVGHNDFADAEGGLVYFRAGYPQAYTSDAQETSATSVRVTGQVNPSGQDSTYRVDYAAAGSAWCDSWGESGAPAGSTPAAALDPVDSDFHSVTVDLTGLTAGAGYCAALVAHNGSGDAFGGLVWVTVGHAHAKIGSVKPAGADGATVTGTVNPGAQSATYKVNYDLSSSTWCQTSGSGATPANSTATVTLPTTDDSDNAVAVTLSGLTPGQSYCVELVAHNAVGDVSGGFATLLAGLPVTSLDAPEPTGPATALVRGSVSPSNQSSTYYFQYAQAGSDFCQTHGSADEASTSTATTDVGFTDATAHPVSATLEDLTPGVTYCVRLVASNAAGREATDTAELTIYPPSIVTEAASGIGMRAATLRATLDGSAQTVSHQFEYATATSAYCKSGGSSGARTTTAAASSTSPAQTVSQAISGLTPGTVYCYRATASSVTGSSTGALRTFRTAPLPPAGVLTPAKVRRATRDGRFDVGGLRCTSASRCVASVVVKGAKSTLASATVIVGAKKTGLLKVVLGPAARAALARARTLTPTVSVKVTSSGAAAVVKQFPLTLKAPLP